jgi:predicted lipid-binding transport protein (Tim44 family)
VENRDGAAVQGNNNKAVGKGGVSIGGNVGGDVVTGKKESITNIFQGNTMIGAIAIVAIVAIVLVMMLWSQPPPDGHPAPTATHTTTASPLPPTATFSPAPTDTPSPTIPPPPACYVTGGDDEAILRRLIALEGEALAAKDASIIADIFAPNAFIADAANRQIWRDPLVRYQSYFDSVQSAQVTRTDIRPVERGLLADKAWFTSGNLTKLTFNDGSQAEYPNQPGSDHWTFARNAQGCWQITGMVFNASHVHFPCYCDQAKESDIFPCLINAEAQAVAEETPLIIWAIFAPDASIQDGDVPLTNNPLDFYLAERFVKFDFLSPQHDDITQIGPSGSEVIYTSGSQGSTRDAAGNVRPYDNANPSDVWYFQRDAAGCWVIGSFAFNQK